MGCRGGGVADVTHTPSVMVVGIVVGGGGLLEWSVYDSSPANATKECSRVVQSAPVIR